MTIGILVFSDPRDDRYASVDELARAIEARGHVAVRIYEPLLSFQSHFERVAVTHDGAPLGEIDVVIARPNFVEEPSLHEHTLRFMARAGYRVLNGLPETFIAKNKLAQHELFSRLKFPMPRWAITKSPKQAYEVAQTFGFPVIVKVAFGTQGKGVFYADSSETFLPIVDYLAVRDKNALIVEEFIAEADRRDLRIFVVGNRVVASMERTARYGDVRANASIGGSGEPVELTDAEEDLALRVAKACELDIAGVDVLRSSRGPLVIEANANPGFAELERVTGIDIAGAIVEEALRRV